MLVEKLKEIGKLETFEIKNCSIVLGLIAPGVYFYSVLIFYFNPSAVEIAWARELFFILFALVALLPLIKKKWVNENYGWIVFGALFCFSNYLIYTTYINNFSLDYLLGTYIVIFGAILMLSNRILIIFFCCTQLMHMIEKVFKANLDTVTEGAIIISMTTIFVYSFIILNGFIRYRKELVKLNLKLEDNIEKRTKDLEIRAKELYERNNDLQDFAYVVSHDLKRPLRNIYTVSHWLLDDNKDKFDDEIVKNLNIIKDQVSQMDLLIEGILDYSLSKSKEGQISKVDLNALVGRLIKVNTTNNCTIKLLHTLPELEFNESQILQVFQNLIGNAIKHNDKEKIYIEIDYKEEAEMHKFSIKDNGPGIEEKYNEKIFKLFQKLNLNAEVDSIGIGLAMVKKIINKNDGVIWLESIMGKQTTFYFTLPK